ncbi:agmatinase [Marinococcus halophilus]|uniref:agmatinase n=1 Tax=Marinococcus halophilus TaxID=1371 RepID=UPI0009A8FD58|nr:agmatinase [Marinococcus halophilus]
MYQPKNSSMSPRYVGIRTFMRLENIRTVEDVDIAVIGNPFDTAVSNRTGQRLGPQHIRDFSILLRPYNPNQEINIFEYCSAVDYGDFEIIPQNIHASYDTVKDELSHVLEHDITPIILGGDHSITLGHLRAFAKHYGPIALVLFDSHSDTWDNYFGEKYMHGTPFRRAVEEGLIDVDHSIMVGLRGPLYGPEDVSNPEELGFKTIPMKKMHELGQKETIRQIHERVGESAAFLSFDVDFVDPAYAPGTGTPEVGGPTSFEALEYIRALNGIDFKGFDLVEVLPSYDNGEITAALASTVAYEMMTLAALQKKNQK